LNASKNGWHWVKSSPVLPMHCRNCWDSNKQTGPADAGTIAGAAGAAGACDEPPPIRELAIMEPATEPAADDAKVPMRPGPEEGGAAATGGGIGATGWRCGGAAIVETAHTPNVAHQSRENEVAATRGICQVYSEQSEPGDTFNHAVVKCV